MKPKIKVTMNAFDRINRINAINNALCIIEESKKQHLISFESYIKWKIISQLEVRCNEFFLTLAINNVKRQL